jgi:hypothetical protein
MCNIAMLNFGVWQGAQTFNLTMIQWSTFQSAEPPYVTGRELEST